jgi:hypothetical protein
MISSRTSIPDSSEQGLLADFPCLDRSKEDNQDSFPNANARVVG